jgi:integrase
MNATTGSSRRERFRSRPEVPESRVARGALPRDGGTLYPSTQTRSSVRDRVRAFLRSCYETLWIPRIPQLPKIKVEELPTLPLTADEYARLMRAVDKVFANAKKRARVCAALHLMRWSGLAIGDALTLRRDEVELHFNVTSPIPGFVVLSLRDYPAWRITVNGGSVSARPHRKDGLIALPINSGVSKVDIAYVRTPDQIAGWMISALSGALLLFIWWKRGRTPSQKGSPTSHKSPLAAPG